MPFKKTEILCGMGRKYCGKRRKCWLPAFSPFTAKFLKGFFLKIVTCRDCVVKVILCSLPCHGLNHSIGIVVSRIDLTGYRLITKIH